MIIEHGPCEYCGNPMNRHRGEDGWHYRRRKCCSSKCAKRLVAHRGRDWTTTRAEKIAIAEMRPCIVCKGPMKHRAFERVSNFQGRQTCSSECATQYRGIQGTVAAKAIATQTKLTDYGQGFGAHNIEPGDGGPMRLVKPDDGLALSVAGRYL